MIILEHVSKVYNGSDKKAVDDLNWVIEDGKITGFVGPNGAGKTTTLKMITGALAPSEGRIIVNGHDIQTNGLAAKKEFGFNSDSPDSFLRVKGIEYLNFMADIYRVPVEKRQDFIEETAKRFDIYDSLGERLSEYSHGMRQKIMVMGALIHSPSVWVLDEPMIGLDPKGIFTLKEMMKEHVEQGKSVLFSTHALELAEKLCDKICVISHGRQQYTGTLEELQEQNPGKSLEDIFLEITGD